MTILSRDEAMKPTVHETIGNNVYPINYVLTFEPNFKSFTTSVHEKISCFAKSPTKLIKLNTKESQITSAFVVFGFKIRPTKIKLDAQREELHIILEEAVVGNFELEINAICSNNDRMYGFYRSKYTYKGKEHNLLTSQFEAANARAAFPCFDEPEFKATFEVSFKIPKSMEALSNMPIKQTTSIDKNTKMVSFEKTVKMSSYLLYLYVGNYEFVEDHLGKLKIRVITVPGKRDLAILPMSYAKKFISWLQNYFGIDFPLPKIDFIGLPDFAAGAMENWGAITFRETALLCDEKTSVSQKQQIAMVVAHELVHQWFGDLVTMEWWDDLWLNESFAEFMSAKAVDSVFPAWDYEVQYVDDTLGSAFAADALKSTHPISVKVNTPGQIDAIFDSISYEKGGSVLYMLEDYVGKAVFRQGLHIYLSRHAYSNARKEHLWEAIQEAASKSGKKLEVSNLMSKWVTKTGHPIVEVEKSSEGFVLTQKRYTILSDMDDFWPIPIHYKTANGTGHLLMSSKRHVVKSSSGWIKLNYGQKGLYRVRYSKELLESIGMLIKSKRIGTLDAWGVENDMFSMVSSGRIPAQTYLDFVDSYCKELGFPLNQNISGHLGWLYKMSYGTPKSEKSRLALIKFNKALIAKLGWKQKPRERDIDTMMRAPVILRLGIAGDKQTTRKVQNMFASLKKGKQLDPNIRGAVYLLSSWTGDSKTFDFLVKRFKSEKLADEQRRFLNSLANFRDKKLMLKALAFSLSSSVRLQDKFNIPAVMSGNVDAYPILLGWTKSNWKRFMKMFEPGTHMLSRYVENLSFHKDEKSLSEIKRFYSTKSNLRDDVKPSIARITERIEANIRFVKRNLKD